MAHALKFSQRTLTVVFVVVALVATMACAGPSDDQLRADIAKEYPGAEFLSAEPGEGDGDHVYLRITFKLSGRECETTWGYRRGSPAWQVFSRGFASRHRPSCPECLVESCT